MHAKMLSWNADEEELAWNWDTIREKLGWERGEREIGIDRSVLIDPEGVFDCGISYHVGVLILF